MPDEQVEELDEYEEAVLEGGTDQGPYTGQSMDIPEVPYNPAAGMTASEVTAQLAENNQQIAEDARRNVGNYPRPDDDDVDTRRD